VVRASTATTRAPHRRDHRANPSASVLIRFGVFATSLLTTGRSTPDDTAQHQPEREAIQPRRQQPPEKVPSGNQGRDAALRAYLKSKGPEDRSPGPVVLLSLRLLGCDSENAAGELDPQIRLG